MGVLLGLDLSSAVPAALALLDPGRDGRTGELLIAAATAPRRGLAAAAALSAAPLQLLRTTVRTVATTAAQTARQAVEATGSVLPEPVRTRAGTVAAVLEALPARAGSVGAAMPARLAAIAGELTDAGPERTRRRRWCSAGRAHLEVRGLPGRGERHRLLADDVTGALSRLKGVHWAEVNAVTSQVLIVFDEEHTDLDRLQAAVEAVEEAHGVARSPFASSHPEHPVDGAARTAAAAALAGDLAGLGLAAAARLARFSALPRGVRAPIALVEAQPRLRRAVQSRIGTVHGDLYLALVTAAAHSTSGGFTPLAVDTLHRAVRLAEACSRSAVWARRESQLHTAGALPREAPASLPRPVELSPGPIESYTDRSAVATLFASCGVLVGTRSPGRAADALMAGVPKAASLGREAYASALSRELASRGVVPMEGAALRRLDRISAVVIDSDVLCTTRPRLLSAVATGQDLDDTAVWQIARDVLGDRSGASEGDHRSGPARGWRLQPTTAEPTGGRSTSCSDLLDETGRHRGTIRVGRELDPLADAVLAAARGSVERVLLTEDASAADVLRWADDVLPATGDLAEQVRALQAEGHGVLLISARDDAALAAADVGVTVLREPDGVCWSADLICGGSLREPWLLLQAIGVARHVSRRSARLALGGSALEALTALGGHRRPGVRGISPLDGAAAIAVVRGVLSAHLLGRLPAPAPITHGDWHALGAHEVLQRLRAQPAGRGAPTGLAGRLRSGREAAGRLARLPVVSHLFTAPAQGAAALAAAVAEELRDPLTPVLALGAAASATMGSSVDALLVGGVMGGSALISGTQRLRAQRALNLLLNNERLTARRLRWAPAEPADNGSAALPGAPVEVTTADRLAPGDLIVLEPSDVVPADARLVLGDELEVDESSLTGESMPVTKSIEATPGADLADRTCMLYEGTTVLCGRAYAVVTAVGAATEAGRAATAAGRGAPAVGVQARLAELTDATLPVTGAAGLAVGGLALLRGMPARRALAAGLAIAVAAVPEGLPLVATAAQLAAARRLTRRGVLVRSSRALEALGRVDTFCFDKTGTLTEGQLTVARTADYGTDLALDGALARRLMRVAARACPQVDRADVHLLAHATDRAVVEASYSHSGPDGSWTAEREFPFETNRGYAAALGVDSGHLRMEAKGAPEVVLQLCTTVLVDGAGKVSLTADLRLQAQRTVERLAGEGLRVLAVAEAEPAERPAAEADREELARDLTLLGFVAIADTPRPTAAEAVRQLTAAGVRVTMITGDHPGTAAAIAAQLGIPAPHNVLTGAELDALPDRARVQRIADVNVFARVSPEEKVRIVQALQSAGHVVAMTGDGTNDAAAIRLADVGIAMSGGGSTSARSAADLVLSQPDPGRLVEALLEGRALWSRVLDAVSILVGGNAGEVAFTVLGTAFDGRPPLGTRQLLLVNMLTDMLPALAVALAPARPGGARGEDPLAAGPVTSLRGPSLSRTLAVRGGATALGATLAWGTGRMTGRRRRADTMGLAALVCTQLGQTLMTGRHSPLVVATSVLSAATLVAIVETPLVSHFFGCTPLGPVAWGIVASSSTAATAAAAAAPHLLGRMAEAGQA